MPKGSKAAAVLFIHRSVGQNLLDDGHLANDIEQLSKNTNLVVTFKDVNNNVNKDIPGENTRPVDYLEYFKKHTFSEDLVVIKSCYPNNAIKSDQDLTELKRTYKELVGAFLGRSSSKLLIMTTPPLRPIRTTIAQASRARLLATWLSSQNFGKRVMVFNFYDVLAEPSSARNANTLRKEYRRLLPWDNHPNKKANLRVSPEVAYTIVEFLKTTP